MVQELKEDSNCNCNGDSNSNSNSTRDTNNNGQWNVGNPAIVTFKSAVEYNQEPKIYKFKLTITNSNNQSVSDTKVVVVKPEINNAPIITSVSPKRTVAL